MSDSDPLQSIDVTASSLEDAIEKGLSQLGLARSEVIIEIVEEGSRGVLGMGARDAVVRLTPLRAPAHAARPAPSPAVSRHEPTSAPRPESFSQRPAKAVEMPAAEQAYQAERQPADTEAADDEEATVGRDVLTELLTQMGVKDVTVQSYRAEPAGPSEEAPWVLNIRGADLGALIGRRGETLNALQYILRLIVSRELQRRANVVVDVEDYKSRREEALRSLAHRMAEQAKRLGKTVTLEPMPPNERRIIHITLREDQTVTTESVGTGDERKVTIIPVSDAG
jgi:spoIIIJ-associated protein